MRQPAAAFFLAERFVKLPQRPGMSLCRFLIRSSLEFSGASLFGGFGSLIDRFNSLFDR
jgi:hypothetical protein